jgi:hypothetical protein
VVQSIPSSFASCHSYCPRDDGDRP